ncbi:uncharacterized protein M6B38_308325 [Iris pallida]|uniref:Uncharacterized protein n=1 Tax=Iris pallida TaxID=29817 RepID=A0AAX6HJN3_IRIPA|nr:uncharacterized protein M6B38_308325 [Iris pallida]
MARLLQCDVAVVRLANLDVLPPSAAGSHLFVRYYIAIGGGKRIRVDTRKLPCGGGTGEGPRWDERASLECRGGGGTDPLEEALGGGGRSGAAVQFELRCRRSATVWGKVAGSRLLGRGEVAWSDAIDSPGAPVERWVG